MENQSSKGFRHGVRSVTCETTTSLLDFVAFQLTLEPAPPALSPRELIELGSVYVNEDRCLNPNRMLRNGDTVRIHTAPRRFAPPKELWSRVLAEDGDSIFIEKPAGLPSEPVVDNMKENLLSYLEDLRGQRFYLAHRLTLESEGLMLIGKSPEAARKISQAFADGQIIRRYMAYLESPLAVGEHVFQNETGVHEVKILSCETQEAETNLLSLARKTWRVVGEALRLTYRIEIEFKSPRPRDIRAWLAANRAPIVGDKFFGSSFEIIDSISLQNGMAFVGTSIAVSTNNATTD